MRIFLSLTIVLSMGLLAQIAAACPNGTFSVEGWNPGVVASKPSYTGTAVIKTVGGGGVCQIKWHIGAQKFQGVGFYNEEEEQLSIAYANQKEGWFGAVVYDLDNTTLKGRWAVYGDAEGRVGKEILQKLPFSN